MTSHQQLYIHQQSLRVTYANILIRYLRKICDSKALFLHFYLTPSMITTATTTLFVAKKHLTKPKNNMI